MSNMTHTEQRLAEVFRSGGLMSHIGSRIADIRRHNSLPQTIRHWSPVDGFVPMTLGS